VNTLAVSVPDGDNTIGDDLAGDYLFNLTINNLILENCRHSDTNQQSAAFFCDAYDTNIQLLTVSIGRSGWLAAPYCTAVILYDVFSGSIGKLQLDGGFWSAMTFLSAGGAVSIDQIYANHFDAQSSGFCFFYLQNSTSTQIDIANFHGDEHQHRPLLQWRQGVDQLLHLQANERLGLRDR
jgi:hypothetical protein